MESPAIRGGSKESFKRLLKVDGCFGVSSRMVYDPVLRGPLAPDDIV